MKHETASVELVARGQGRCAGTAFSGETLGKSHKFRFAEHSVIVSLPKVRFEAETRSPTGKNAHLFTSSTSYAPHDQLSHRFFKPTYLRIKISIPGRHEVPTSTLDSPVMQMPSHESDVTEALDRLSAKYDVILFNAFRHWVEVARWATNQHRLALADFEPYNREELYLPRISLCARDFDIWESSLLVSLLSPSLITLDDWNHIRSVLKSGANPPIWFKFLCEAHERFERYDFAGALLSSAFACEAVARSIFATIVGTPTNIAAAELVDKTSVRSILGRWSKLTGLKVAGDVHKLFDRRNDLVHSRMSGNLSREIAKEAISAGINFVDQADVWWFAHSGTLNPRTKSRSIP